MRKNHVFLSVAASIFLALFLSLNIATAQDNRSAIWLRWDVTIDALDMINNSYHVTEAHEVAFTGMFRFGTRVIALRNLDHIRDIRVYQGNQELRSECADAPGTVCVTDTAEGAVRTAAAAVGVAEAIVLVAAAILEVAPVVGAARTSGNADSRQEQVSISRATTNGPIVEFNWQIHGHQSDLG